MSTSNIATSAFLAHLESLYPKAADGRLTPWYLIVAAAFSASNVPEAVPEVYKFVDQRLKTDEERLVLARKLRDAIFKSGMTSGYAKAINALAQLHAVMPEKFRDVEPVRDTATTTAAINAHGQEYFNQTYGETATTVQPFLRDIYPDMEFFSTTFAYGWVYGCFKVTTPIETSFSMVAALIASDTPKQIDWHLKGARRNGASQGEIMAAREISIQVAKAAGIRWKNEIPDV